MMKTFRPLDLEWGPSIDSSTQLDKSKSCQFYHKLSKNYFFKMIGDTSTQLLWLFLKSENTCNNQKKFNLF